MSEPWFASKNVESRVAALLGRMTQDDKLNLVSGNLTVDDSSHCPPLPDGLPELRLADGPAGLRIAGSQNNKLKSTALPAPIALAATWEPELARQYGDLLGQEAAVTGHNILLGPAVDIARAPLGGRTFESFGEDPLLQTRVVASEVAALQVHAVAACIKHYLVNNQEYKRNLIDVQVDERTLREIYLPPFVVAVQQGHVAAVMASYNRINGTYACENPFTLTKILRQELGFCGFVMSDFMAAMSTSPSALAGLEWELGTKMWGPALQAAVESGELSLELLDEMVRRILRPILGLGLADRPRHYGTINIAAHSALAREIAEQGIVLLKNNAGLLPLDVGKIHSIAVIGADADNVSAAGGGSAFVRPTLAVSVLDGIRQRVGKSVRITYAPGTDPVGPGALLPGLAAIPSSFFPHGLRVEYWDNPDFAGQPLVARTEPRIEFNYGFIDFFTGSLVGFSKLQFKPAELSGRLTARVTGQLELPTADNLQMTLTCLGMARLYLDDRLVLDTSTAVPDAMPGNNSQASVYSVQVSRITAQTCALRLEYSNFMVDGLHFNEAMLRLGWQLPEGLLSRAIQQAAALAAKSDLAIVVARTYETEEIDRPNMELPNGQADLIRAVAAANPNTLVVLMNAGPVDVASWEAVVPAILEAWYAGQEQGSALARILFGDVNPSGRLPLTFPRNLAQTPVSTPAQYPGVEDKVYYSEGLFVGYRGYDRYEIVPQYPFGYGLSYTTFEYANLLLDSVETDGTRPICISFEISNIGSRAGVDVAQVYLCLPAHIAGPLKRLAGWARIAIQPGESKQVTVVLEPGSVEHPLSFWNVETQAWEIAPGEYQVHLGASARDIRLTASFKIQK